MQLDKRSAEFNGRTVPGSNVDVGVDGEQGNEDIKELLEEGRELRLAVVRHVRGIFKKYNNDIAEGKAVEGNDLLLDFKNTEDGQLDEYLFCHDLFSKIHKVCFADVDIEDNISKHVMARVLNGTLINWSSEHSFDFIYDYRDRQAKRILQDVLKVKTLKKLMNIWRNITVLCNEGLNNFQGHNSDDIFQENTTIH